ncbi:DUF4239 domain-containing protein [Siculibacillus lacustris]|uniref:DUF4239 domain-containing protein n=1 Tax=Siculibacillus lacustris TaxID=1549641 RepID=A0A4Q9VDX1_9HYPH|nr:DUF4239 domain-containing protein [Siculibacillus lacustris]TBW32913.1 DUF4239 domain-containing protein [Siculibacillus lacustris]
MTTFDWGAYDHYGFALVALAGTALACLGLGLILASPRHRPRLAGLAGVAPPFINIIGVLFALTLAFLANDTWSAHDRAITAVTREADALDAIGALTRSLPDTTRRPIEAAVGAYAVSAVEIEWPQLARRVAAPATAAALERLLTLAADPGLGAPLGPAVHARLLTEVMAVRDARDLRVALSQTHVNPLKWLGMAFLGFVTMLSVAVVHVEHPRAALVAILLFAAAAAPTAAIVLIQGNPFQRPTTVSAAPIAARIPPAP